MYASIRSYAGDRKLAETLASRSDEVKTLMEKASGFNAYYLLRSDDATVSVTFCEDKAGVEQSDLIAAGWLREHMPDAARTPPKVVSGEVVFHTARQPIVV
jgi:hypothetical protein